MAANKDRDIWESGSWQTRRSKYRAFRQWYEGLPLEESVDKRNRKRDQDIKKFPLDINLPKLACDLHKDIARGIPDSDSPLIVQTTVERNFDEAEYVEDVINDVWRMSYGSDIQQRGLLDMGIYGGTSYLLKWAPWERYLPYRMAVRKIQDPGCINPTWSGGYDPWRMVECYIGFEISRDEAIAKYGIHPPEREQRVLYLEYWSENEWWVHVYGQVPKMRWNGNEWDLEGENPFGFVPIYYIPHERTTELFGDSQIPEQTELTREFNSRAANISDIVRSSRPGLLIGSDINRSPSVEAVTYNGKVVFKYINIGDTRALQHAESPKMSPVPVPDIPEGLVGFPMELLNWWMMVQRISPVSFGLDDTQSGRITGPSVAQRMWTSMAHATTERINYSTAKTMLDTDIIRALKVKSPALAKLGLEAPELGNVDVNRMRLKQRWPPMIPLDRQQLTDELIDKLREGGISLERFLEADGVEDVEEERGRIMKLLEEKAEIEAKSQPQMPQRFGGQ